MQLWWVIVFVVIFVTVDINEGRRLHPERDGNHVPDNYREVDPNTGIVYNPYSKHHPGRHVCTNMKNSNHPLTGTTKEPHCEPTYRKYVVKCGDQWCAGVKLVYEKRHKNVISNRNSDEITYACCPGWTQVTNRSHGCNKPICRKPCQNGGKCVRPGLCSCLKNFTGAQCEKQTFPSPPPSPSNCERRCLNGGSCTSRGICKCLEGFHGTMCDLDVDECKEYKPCDQICYNTPGSYNCQCRENFSLQKDGQSCRVENDEGTSIEARDLELESLDKRLVKLETMMDNNHKNEVTKHDIQAIHGNIDTISSNIKDLRGKLINMEFYRSDMHIFKNKLNQIEQKANKVDDLLLKYEKMKKCAFYNKICI